MTQPLHPDKEKVAHCEICGDISVPSAIGDDCDGCDDGFYEEFIKTPCPSEPQEACQDNDHIFSMWHNHYHLYRPEDVPEDA